MAEQNICFYQYYYIVKRALLKIGLFASFSLTKICNNIPPPHVVSSVVSKLLLLSLLCTWGKKKHRSDSIILCI